MAKCTKPVYINGAKFRCGKCASCVDARAREWALRLTHELDYYDKASFITLTYENTHQDEDTGLLKENQEIPVNLNKPDLQNFFKRLRKNNPELELKYFAVGEYGEKYYRPHYHIIMLGMDQRHPEFTCVWPAKKLYRMKSWNNGLAHVGIVNTGSIRYVTGYLSKKSDFIRTMERSGELAPQFTIVSQGIGKRFLKKHQQTLAERGLTTTQGVPHALPRYYRKLIGEKNEELSVLLLDRAFMKRQAEQAGYMELIFRRDIDTDQIDVTIGLLRANEQKQIDKNIRAKQELKTKRK